MSYYAFKDKERTQVIYANEASRFSREITYYCPTYNCNAHLYVCSINGIKTPYFSATKPNFRHSPDCFYKKNYIDINDYSEQDFNFNSFCESLLVPGKEKENTLRQKGISEKLGNSSCSVKEKINTLRKLYLLCKSKDVRDTYNKKEIGYMLLDKRSLYMNPKGIFGYRIIEAVVQKYFYNNDDLELYYFMKGSDKYRFILKFEDQERYKETRDTIYNNKDHVIVIFGEWEKSKIFNNFVSSMFSKKQIYIVP
ncbi:hypothetical protein [Rodentibacter caecimuris]|uniref:Uncharacterized protein n=1 Tax=Rodentibacter caecimuris TaxID=1796644 RepID=A0ABX3KYL2_9PAST|nr:hypothetical protein BKG89_02875 [Rodentibacter heylii]